MDQIGSTCRVAVDPNGLISFICTIMQVRFCGLFQMSKGCSYLTNTGLFFAVPVCDGGIAINTHVDLQCIGLHV